MNKKDFLACFCAIIASYIFLPSELCATPIITEAGVSSLNDMVQDVQKLIFGAPINLICVFGAGMGIYQMMAQNSVTPLLTWGSIALMVKFIPTFLKALFP